jgi:CubicO group peptidase (beta-lactamase class C family)
MRAQADLVAAGGPQFETALASFVTGNRLAGGVAGVVYGDELAWSAGAGFADQAARKASDPAMLYAIASITKTFTGTAIMQLRDAGRLDLDDPAVAWLPELRQAASPFGPIETVTLRRMLSHESGLPAEPPGTDWEAHRHLRRTGQLAGRARTDQRPGYVHRRTGRRPDRGTRAVPAAGWRPGGFGGPDGDHLGAAGTRPG